MPNHGELKMCKVWNKRQANIPSGAVHVGRPTKWGNQYSHMHGTLAKYKVNSRDEAVDAYEADLLHILDTVSGAREQLQAELRGKDLVCWCAPQRCHADVLMKYANQQEEQE